MHLSFVHPLKSSLFMIHYQYSFSPTFFATTIMQFSTPNICINIEAKPNDLCVGVGHLARHCNNNILNGPKQEALFNVGTNDLIVCHNEMVGFEILPLCIRCHKCLITYHKVNGIFIMKKYVEQNHVVLVKRQVKEVHLQILFHQELTTKWHFVSPSAILDTFPLQIHFQKTMEHKKGSQRR